MVFSASACGFSVRSVHLTVTTHGSYSPLIRHPLARCPLPSQLLARFTPTARCTFSLSSVLGLQVSTFASLETELLLQYKPLVHHFLELCPQGQNMPLQSLEHWNHSAPEKCLALRVSRTLLLLAFHSSWAGLSAPPS